MKGSEFKRIAAMVDDDTDVKFRDIYTVKDEDPGMECQVTFHIGRNQLEFQFERATGR